MQQKTLTKGSTAEALEAKFGLNAQFSKEFVNEFFDLVIMSLKEGRHVQLRTFNNLIIRRKQGGRPVRNPKTGEEGVMPSICTVVTAAKRDPEFNPIVNTSELIELMVDFSQRKYHRKSEQEVAELVKEIIFQMSRTTSLEYRMEIRGLGVFGSRAFEARRVRNPKTGETLQQGETVRDYFKVSRLLRTFLTEKYATS